MNFPEGNEPAPSSTREELTNRFARLFDGVTPVTTSQEYEVAKPSNSLMLEVVRILISRRIYRHQVTKQTITKRVDDKKYLSGPYRTPDWGELIAEHILEDKIVNIRKGEVVESRPERYALKFLDHSLWPKGSLIVPAGGDVVRKEDFISSDVAFGYEFSPDPASESVTITAAIGPVVHPGDKNYPYFLRALELAEDLFSPDRS